MIDQVLPPARALEAALLVVVPVSVACALGGWLSGPIAVAGIALGVTGAVQGAVCDASIGWKMLVVGVSALLGAAGVWLSDRPLLLALLVAAAGFAEWPVNRRSAGMAVLWPALPPLAASTGVQDAWGFAIWLAVGGAVILGLAAAALTSPRPIPGVTGVVAARHAVATGLAAALASYITATLGLSHGYWLVLTLALVLRPQRGESSGEATDRVAGTLLGVVVGIGVVVLLPLVVSLILVVAFLVLTVGWALAGNRRRQSAFVTPAVLILGSGGVAGTTVGLAVERLLFTVLGAAVAVGLAVLLHRWDAREGSGAAASAGR